MPSFTPCTITLVETVLARFMSNVDDNEFASKDIASVDVAGTAFSPTVTMLFRDEREPAGGLHTK